MNSLKKLESFIVSFDRFGKGISVEYKGDDEYKTRLGTLVTIATYVLIAINLVNLVTAFQDNSKQIEMSSSLQYDTFGVDPINLEEMNLKALVWIDPPIPEQIGHFSIFHNSLRDKQEFPLQNCDEETKSQYAAYWERRQRSQQAIDRSSDDEVL